MPTLRRNGTLPRGVHPATMAEVLQAYPSINQQRQILNDSLQRAVIELRKLEPTLVIFVDGSYITNKAEPNDVDLLIKIDRFLETEIIDYLEQACPVEAVSLDINVEPTTQTYLFDLFTTDDLGRAKGIIQIG